MYYCFRWFGDWQYWNKEMHTVTFEVVRSEIGAGMRLNGSFFAPVDGVYW